MFKRSLTRLAIGVGGLALASTAAAGVASAAPDYGPMINTTCSYDQAMRAVHAENPMAARYLDQSPPNQQFLQQYLASSPDQRVNLRPRHRAQPGRAAGFADLPADDDRLH